MVVTIFVVGLFWLFKVVESRTDNSPHIPVNTKDRVRVRIVETFRWRSWLWIAASTPRALYLELLCILVHIWSVHYHSVGLHCHISGYVMCTCCFSPSCSSGGVRIMTLLAYLSSQPAVKVSLLQLLKTRQVLMRNTAGSPFLVSRVEVLRDWRERTGQEANWRDASSPVSPRPAMSCFSFASSICSRATIPRDYSQSINA